MNIVLLYLLLLKGTVTAFAGLASLPVLQDSLVTQYHVLTNDQLNDAVVITRSSPGPVGLYVVSVGYFVAGLPGAVAGWLAMITPALLIIPLVYFVGRKMEHPKVKSVLQAVIIASAGLLRKTAASTTIRFADGFAKLPLPAGPMSIFQPLFNKRS